MILPSKHIKISESYIGIGSVLLKMLDVPMTIDEIWNQLQKDDLRPLYLTNLTFDSVVLALNLLYAIGAIKINKKGKMSYAVN